MGARLACPVSPALTVHGGTHGYHCNTTAPQLPLCTMLPHPPRPPSSTNPSPRSHASTNSAMRSAHSGGMPLASISSGDRLRWEKGGVAWGCMRCT